MHELRHPLGAIKNFAMGGLRMLDPELEGAASLKAIFERIQEEANRADALARCLLDLSGGSAACAARLKLGEVMDEAFSLLPSAVNGEPVEIDWDLPAELPQVRMERALARQALLTVMTNGLEAMSELAGPLRLVVRARRRSDGSVEVTIRDLGSSSEAVDLERLFERGFTTKRGHSGLGLWLSRTLMEAGGGRLLAKASSEGGLELIHIFPTEKDSPAE